VHTLRESVREKDLELVAVAEHPSALPCEQIGYAVGAARGPDSDAMVRITNRLLAAAGFTPLHIQRRRR
jgi:hypothetical protein